MKARLDNFLVDNNMVSTRSQAESYIRLGQVRVNGIIVKKPGYFISRDADVQFGVTQQYVSRAALKLASVVDVLNLNFDKKTILDVGSSTGGFTDYALQHGAGHIFAVDVGTGQMHPRLRANGKITLYEKTDIRDVALYADARSTGVALGVIPDLILIDVSFISLKLILPHIKKLASKDTEIIAMLKPQFEGSNRQLNKGIVKNNTIRRNILQQFEAWCRDNELNIRAKSDSSISGKSGNLERFYLLKKIQ